MQQAETWVERQTDNEEVNIVATNSGSCRAVGCSVGPEFEPAHIARPGRRTLSRLSGLSCGASVGPSDGRSVSRAPGPLDAQPIVWTVVWTIRRAVGREKHSAGVSGWILSPPSTALRVK